MATHIDDLMTHSGGVIFVGVGLLHLLGDNGLPPCSRNAVTWSKGCIERTAEGCVPAR
ncbi:hypothetical protein [Massilia haematophila]|uniref:Uncharacterized protein n=1 Tax=Massilia haematophila TaxID=457923 RepID=A0ABV7PET4_9BURK